MKFIVSADQLAFFEKEHYIEFEKFFSEKDIEALKFQVLTAYYKKKAALEPEMAYQKGYNLAIGDEQLMKVFKGKKVSQAFRELTFQKGFRFGFDQYIIGGPAKYPLINLLDKQSVREFVGGIIICLEGEVSDTTPLPKSSGNIIFFNKQAPISLSLFEARPGQKFWFAGFVDLRGQYILEKEDIHTHELKNLGYVFGDRLQEKYHPIILQ